MQRYPELSMGSTWARIIAQGAGPECSTTASSECSSQAERTALRRSASAARRPTTNEVSGVAATARAVAWNILVPAGP